MKPVSGKREVDSTGKPMPPFIQTMPEPPAYTTCPVLFQDAALLVVDKPTGVLSHPNEDGAGAPGRCAFLGTYSAGERRFQTPCGPLWLIHRLDEDTSGVLLAAKTQAAAGACRLAFEQDRVRKHYLALVRAGSMKPKGAWLDHLVTSAGKGRVRTQVRAHAKPNAELHYRLVGQHASLRLSLLDIDLYTGRTHQIRVQAASRSYPIVGDDVYGDFSLNRELRRSHGLNRLFLHAHTLAILHPVTRQKLTFHSPLPAELADVLRRLSLADKLPFG